MEKAAKERVFLTGDDEICGLFDSVITKDDDIFIFYKVNYEYQLISYRFRANWISGLEERIKKSTEETAVAYHLAESEKNQIMLKVRTELKKQVIQLFKMRESLWERLQ